MSTDIVFGENRITVKGELVVTDKEGRDGDIFIQDKDGVQTIHLGGNDARLELGAEGASDGDIFIRDKDGNQTIQLAGSRGTIQAQTIQAVTLELKLAEGGGTLKPSPVGLNVKSGLEIDEFLRIGGVAQFAGGSSGPGTLFISDDQQQMAVSINGQDGSIHFGNGETPLLYVFESGSSNPDRPIISHSPNNPDSGLLYRDKGSKMIFQAPGRLLTAAPTGVDDVELPPTTPPIPVLTVDLEQGNVGIGTDEPDEDYELYVFGKSFSTGFELPSDARCKEDVETIVDASEKVSRLRGVGFRWTEDACGDMGVAPGRHLGLIAQETKEVLPEVVSQGGDGYYSLAYDQLVPVLVEAFKEQQRRISELRAENAATQQALEQAEARAERLESVEERLAELERMLEREPAGRRLEGQTQ